MIVKSLETFIPRDAREAAGQRAEQEMAFYLRRAFASSPDLWVFNNLRFVFGEEVAQIDHLVLHRYGVVIIESKRVTTRVEVNEHGEWSRGAGVGTRGMPSPVLQAQRQGEFLRRYLNAHAEELLGRVLLLQKRFGGMELDVLVAVSDEGIIVRPRRGKSDPLPEVCQTEVCKADQATDRVRAIHERHRKANSLAGLALGKESGYWWTPEELDRLRAFLLARHRTAPIKPTALTPPRKAAHAGFEKTAQASLAGPAVCAVCGVPVSGKVERYCRDNAARFEGRILCYSHQHQGPEFL